MSKRHHYKTQENNRENSAISIFMSKRGGSDLENWLEAERALKEEQHAQR